MEYKEILNLLYSILHKLSKFREKIGLKQMIMLVKRIVSIVKLYLKLQC